MMCCLWYSQAFDVCFLIFPFFFKYIFFGCCCCLGAGWLFFFSFFVRDYHFDRCVREPTHTGAVRTTHGIDDERERADDGRRPVGNTLLFATQQRMRETPAETRARASVYIPEPPQKNNSNKKKEEHHRRNNKRMTEKELCKSQHRD